MVWTNLKISDLANVSSGGGAPQDADAFSDTGVPFVRAGSLIKLLGGLPETELELLQAEVAKQYKLKLFPVGTILFAKSGMSATKGHIYKLKSPAYVVNHLAALVPHSESDADYLHHVLRFKSPTSLIKDEAYPSIRLGDIEEMEVPAPHAANERKRIAAILDQADDIRRKRQHAIDRLNQLGQAIFHEMFGEDNGSTIEIETLLKKGFLTVHKDGNHGSNYPRKEDFGQDGVPFLSAATIDDIGNVIPNQVTYLNERKAKSLKFGWIKKGDVLLSHNASVGKVALYDGSFGPALIGTSLTCFRPNLDVFDPYFLFLTFKSSYFQNQLTANMSQTTRNQVPITAQRKLRIPCPELTEQNSFASKMQKIEPHMLSNMRSQTSVNQLFASLQHRAFTGQL
jgi:type I restriction enzyme S subunit